MDEQVMPENENGLTVKNPTLKTKSCDVCGRDCTQITGVNIQLWDDEERVKEISEIRDLFGETEFNVCFVCYILSLGIRPKS